MGLPTATWLLLLSSVLAGGETNHKIPFLRGQQDEQQAATKTERKLKIDNRIVGGSAAPLDKIPSHVQWKLGCGGSLFHDDLVLTAAHCFNNAPVALNWPVYVGGNGTSESGTEMYAEAGYRHPLYNPSNIQAYDFAVLQLPQQVTGIEFMSLNTDRDYPVNGQELTVMGFGLLNETDTIVDAPNDMHEVTVPMIGDCVPYYTSDRINEEIVFCAGDMPGGGKDACLGDSGGPIVDAYGTQVGLVSWGIGCAQEYRPGVYARVSAISQWLEFLKCDVSMYPPAGCTRLDVNMTYDDYPEETGFRVIDDNHPQRQGMIFELPERMDIPQRATIHYSYQLPIGNYTFVYADTSLDGSCCDFGDGRAIITNEGKGVNVSGDFSSYGQQAAIEIPLPYVGFRGAWIHDGSDHYTGTSVQQRSDKLMFGIQLVIMYDLERVHDITWKLYIVNELGGGELILLRHDAPDPARVLDSYNRQSFVVQDLPEGSYEFHMEDASGRGFARGVGFARITLLDNPTGVFLGRLFHIPAADIEPLTVARFGLGG
ncbi:Plasminogen (Fragment) [Seminavis robusta]|uniref:Plasminogen n=1 Tax=Seminavis robusta TaxID=568900 RepID=A0A9N8HV57_9STRA